MKTLDELKSERTLAVDKWRRESPFAQGTTVDLYEARLHLNDLEYYLRMREINERARPWWRRIFD